MIDKVKQGKKNKVSGAEFERRVKKDLEAQGLIVDRWSNNVDLDKQKLIPAKVTWRKTPKGMFPLNLNSGFPDFISFKPFELSSIVGVECKINGILDKIEKEKCKWYLYNGVFDKILIASKYKEGKHVVVKYKEFE